MRRLAACVADGTPLPTTIQVMTNLGPAQLETPVLGEISHRERFEAADQEAQNKGEFADALLHLGRLELGPVHGQIIREVAPEVFFPPQDDIEKKEPHLSPGQVADLWRMIVDAEDEYRDLAGMKGIMYWSLRYFLEACTDLGLGVNFEH